MPRTEETNYIIKGLSLDDTGIQIHSLNKNEKIIDGVVEIHIPIKAQHDDVYIRLKEICGEIFNDSDLLFDKLINVIEEQQVLEYFTKHLK